MLNLNRNKARINGIFLALLLVGSFLVVLLPVSQVAAAPTLLTRKWTGYVAGGGESLLIADILSSPGEEIIHVGGGVQPYSGAGRVSVLRASDGVRIATTTHEGIGDTCQAQMADIDNDGLLEIIVPLQQPAGLVIYNSEDLSILWQAPGSYSGDPGYFTYPDGGRVDSSPVIGDIDNDGYKDIFVGAMAYEKTPQSGSIRHLEYDPTYSDSFPGAGGIVQRNLRVVWHPCAGGMSLGDTDNDGVYELYMADRSQGGMTDGSWGRGLRSFWAENLTSRWDVYYNMMSSNIPMIADVNGDGIRDIVATDLSRAVMVVNSSNGHPLVNDVGQTLSGSISGRANHYQSSVYDIDGDGALEILSGDGWEGGSDTISVFDLWNWTLDATIDTTIVGDVPTRSWKGPTVGEVTGDGVMDIIVTCYATDNSGNGMLQVYNSTYDLVLYTDTNFVHRAIDSVVQDVDNDDLNELFVLTQGGQIYCYDTDGIAASPRARSEVQFYSESRLGASEYVAYEPPHTSASYPSAPVLPNDAPEQGTPILSGSTELENLVCNNQSTTDSDGDEVTNIYRWTRNGASIANLILPFESMTDPELEYSGFAYTQDYSGYGNDGNVFGASWTDEGIVGGAYSFDGSNDFIRIEEQGNSLGGDGSWNDITVEFWVKATSSTSTRARALLQKQARPYPTNTDDDSDIEEPWWAYTGYRVDFSASSTTDTITWRIYTQNASDPVTPIQYSVTANIGDRADWHHVVCTYTSGVGLKIYADGSEVNSVTGVSGNILETNNSPTTLRDLGDYLGDWGYNFPGGMMNINKGPLEIGLGGMLDEVRIYPSEITPGQVYERYMDTKDGLSNKSTLSKYETSPGEQWRCYVTPNDGKIDGSTLPTSIVTITDVVNDAPVASNLEITPASPVTGDDLVANYDYFDANGHPELGSVISWYNDESFVVTGAVLSSSETTKGDSWTFEVTPSDGFDFGDTEGPSAPVLIGNTAPSFTSVVISPDPAFAGNTLTANCFGFSDPDADAVEGYTYQWQKLVASVWTNVGSDSQTLSSSNFVTGDYVKVIVTVDDGEDVGNTIEAIKWIVDSDPPTTGTPVLVSGSGSVRDDDELTCTPVDTDDPEGDEVTEVYNWLKGGVSYTNLNMPFETNSSTDAVDYSGNGNNGEVYGATHTDGIVGGGYSFDGNDYITVEEQGSSLGGDGSWDEISVEFWIRASGSTTSTQTVVAKTLSTYVPGGSVDSSYRVQYRYGSNNYRVYFYLNAYSINQRVYNDDPLGWHHVVCTYESSVGLNIYTDGILRASLEGTGNIDSSVSGLLYLGGVNSGSGDFSGEMDEVKIYDEALSAAQVFQNFVDGNDGLSDGVTIVPSETSNTQTWRCQVTPNDGWQDGTTQFSELTITSPNTIPHIDSFYYYYVENVGNVQYYYPVESDMSMDVEDSVVFEVVCSDPDASTLSFEWTLDSVVQGGAVTDGSVSSWTYTPSSGSIHIVGVEVSDGDDTDYQEWTVDVSSPVPQHTLTVNVVEGGSVTLDPAGGTYDEGTVVTLTPVADPGWTFDSWGDDLSGSDDPETITMDADKTVSATFTQDEYTLTVTPVGSGTVSKDPSQATYHYGDVVTLTATPDNEDWAFVGWSGDVDSTDNPLDLTIIGDMSVTATFTDEFYVLTVNVVGNGHVDLDPAGGTYAVDTVVGLDAVADLGWTFAGWSGALSGDTNPETVTMNADKTVTATFTEDEYTLTVTIVGSGSVVKSPNQATYHYGESVTLTASAAGGWMFTGWSSDLSGSVNPESITMDGDKTVTATFTVIPPPYLFADGFESGDFSEWTDTTTVSGSTSVTSSTVYNGVYSGQFDVIAGTSARRAYCHINLDNLDEVIARAYVYIPSSLSLASGQKLFVVQLRDSGSQPLASYGVIADGSGMSWAVQYANYPFALGTTVPSGGGWYLLEAYFTHASSGPTLVLSVDDAEVASLNQDTSGTNNVASAWFGNTYYTGSAALTVYVDDVAINPEPTPDYTLTVNTVGNGDVTLNPAGGAYSDGTVVSLTAVADLGWTFDGWSDDLSGSVNPESITMNDDKTVTATFTQNEYTLTVSTVGSGSVDKSPDQATYHYGDIVTLTPNADAGWTFDSWSGDYSGTDNPLAMTITGDTSVTATFTQDQYTLTVNTAGSGSVVKSPNQATYLYGDSVTLTANPNTDWMFSGWSGDLTGSVNPESITMDEDKTITATFTVISPPYLFADGYESGNFAQWTGTTTVSGSAAVTSSVVYNGVYSGQFNANAGTSARRAYSHINVGGLTEVYAQAYVYIPSSLALANGQKLFAIQFRDSSSQPLASFGVMADASGMRWAVQNGNSPYALGTAVPSSGGWYLLEAYFTQAASGPTIVLSVDGLEVASLNQNTSGANDVASAWFGNTYYTGSAALTVYVDDVAINPEPTPDYTLTVNTVGNGDVTLNPAGGAYSDGTVVGLTAVADLGWTFDGWSGDLSGSVNPESITMNGDKTVTATFTQNEYTLTVSTIGSGSIDKSPDQATYHYGDSVTLTANPDTDWMFAGWTGDVSSTDNPLAVTITGDTSVTATFTNEKLLTVNVAGGGSVALDPDQLYYSDGTVVTLTATANLGWTFDGWSGDLSGSASPETITMDDHKTVTATFTQNEYTLTVTTVGLGSVDKSPDQATYHYGDIVTLTPNADAGWTFDSWSGDVSGSDDPLAITIDSDTSVTATFTEDVYTLTVNVVGSGSVDLDISGPYVYGNVVELTANADADWMFTGWSGDLTGSVNPESITMDSDKTVTATFNLISPPYLFADGYESGNFAQWTGTTTVSGSTAVTSTEVYTGVYSGQFDVIAGSSARRAYSHINVGSLTEVIARAYVYIPSSLALANGQKLFVIQFRDASSQPLACFGIMADASGMRWAVQNGNWPYALGTAVPSTGGWYLLEAFFTQAASGPTIVLSVDGLEVASLNQNTSGANDVASAWFGNTYYTGSAALTVYVDDVAVD